MESDRYQEIMLCQYEYRSANKQFGPNWDTVKPDIAKKK